MAVVDPFCFLRSTEKGIEHRVILGTHTSDSEQNYILIAKVSPAPALSAVAHAPP